jgi:hypothetical protein
MKKLSKIIQGVILLVPSLLAIFCLFDEDLIRNDDKRMLSWLSVYTALVVLYCYIDTLDYQIDRAYNSRTQRVLAQFWELVQSRFVVLFITSGILAIIIGINYQSFKMVSLFWVLFLIHTIYIFLLIDAFSYISKRSPAIFLYIVALLANISIYVSLINTDLFDLLRWLPFSHVFYIPLFSDPMDTFWAVILVLSSYLLLNSLGDSANLKRNEH